MPSVLNGRGGIKIAHAVDVYVIEAFLTGTEWRWTEQGGPQMKHPVTGLWHSLVPQIIDGQLSIGISEEGEE